MVTFDRQFIFVPVLLYACLWQELRPVTKSKYHGILSMHHGEREDDMQKCISHVIVNARDLDLRFGVAPQDHFPLSMLSSSPRRMSYTNHHGMLVPEHANV